MMSGTDIPLAAHGVRRLRCSLELTDPASWVGSIEGLWTRSALVRRILKFLSVLRQVRLGNFKFKAALETISC
jgi:hypothetical protein